MLLLSLLPAFLVIVFLLAIVVGVFVVLPLPSKALQRTPVESVTTGKRQFQRSDYGECNGNFRGHVDIYFLTTVKPQFHLLIMTNHSNYFIFRHAVCGTNTYMEIKSYIFNIFV